MTHHIQSPVISVLMGIYNCEKYLREVIESLLKQTFTDYEIIIVNDGSTDGSSKILDEYANKNEKIKVITQENQGLGAALNAGISVAKGEFIARIDADDYPLPERLEKQLAFMKENQNVVAAGSKVMLVDPLGIPIFLNPFYMTHNEIEEQLLKGNGGAICHPSVMIRQKALLKIGGYDTRWRVTEDLDLFLRLAEIGQLANMPDVLLNWRQHLTSANHTKREQQVNECHALLREAYQKRGLVFNENNVTERLEISHADWLRRWGWNALSKGRRFVALRYVLKSFLLKPFSSESYKLVGCILRGR